MKEFFERVRELGNAPRADLIEKDKGDGVLRTVGESTKTTYTPPPLPVRPRAGVAELGQRREVEDLAGLHAHLPSRASASSLAVRGFESLPPHYFFDVN